MRLIPITPSIDISERLNFSDLLTMGSFGKLIGNTKPKKAPLNLPAVDKAADALNSHPIDRAYFDFLRFTGLRKDEANQLRWDDINFDEGYFHCKGTKTDEADAYLPLADALVESLKKLKTSSTSEYVFPGNSPTTKNKRIYSRRQMFERIQKKTGIKLKAKDLRDYFASTVQTDDPRTLMRLMRHTNLTTTTKYLLAEQDRMKDAVKNLGATLGATQNTSRGQKTVQNDMLAQLAQMLISGGSMGNLMRKTTAVDGAVIAKLTDGCHTSGKSDA